MADRKGHGGRRSLANALKERKIFEETLHGVMMRARDGFFHRDFNSCGKGLGHLGSAEAVSVARLRYHTHERRDKRQEGAIDSVGRRQ
jgi:hypothetical protein